MLLDAESLFRLLADPTRLRIVLLLAAEDELCVCELTHALDLSQPKISRHLAALREAGVLESRRAGKWIYYRSSTHLPDWTQNILHHTLLGNSGSEPFHRDRRKLKNMPNRPGAACCA